MEAVGIIKDDELNREKANEMAWATSEDTLDECEKEVAGIIRHISGKIFMCVEFWCKHFFYI